MKQIYKLFSKKGEIELAKAKFPMFRSKKTSSKDLKIYPIYKFIKN